MLNVQYRFIDNHHKATLTFEVLIIQYIKKYLHPEWDYVTIALEHMFLKLGEYH
jgi:hypothetical protein